MIARTLQRSRKIFFLPWRVSTSCYLLILAGRRNRIRIIAEQRGMAGEGGGRILSRRNGSEWKSETRLALLTRSRVRLSSKRSLQRRNIGHDSNGSEIVMSSSRLPTDWSTILTQLRYESVPFFSVSFFLPFLSRKRPLRSSRSGTRLFSLLFRFEARANTCPSTFDPTTDQSFRATYAF